MGFARDTDGLRIYDPYDRDNGNDVGNGWTEYEDAAADLQLFTGWLYHVNQGDTDYTMRTSPAAGNTYIVQCNVQILNANGGAGLHICGTTPGSDGYVVQLNRNSGDLEIWDESTSTKVANTAYTPGEGWNTIRCVVTITPSTSTRIVVYAGAASSGGDRTATLTEKLDYTDSTSPNQGSGYGTSQGWWSSYIDSYMCFGHDIVVSGLPSGWKVQIDSDTPVIESGGSVTIDVDGRALPATVIKILDSVDVEQDSLTPSGGIYGGDIYSFSQDIVWGGGGGLFW
jgi:hypothetical protein